MLEEEFWKKKRAFGTSCRMDETYITIKGEWYYLYRTYDKENNTIDFLFAKKRGKKVANGFFVKVIDSTGLPENITIDKSCSNKADLKEYNAENDIAIEIRQEKYLNNTVEQGYRGIKWIVRPMLGFKEFHSASVTLGGIELVRMIRKNSFKNEDNLS